MARTSRARHIDARCLACPCCKHEGLYSSFTVSSHNRGGLVIAEIKCPQCPAKWTRVDSGRVFPDA